MVDLLAPVRDEQQKKLPDTDAGIRAGSQPETKSDRRRKVRWGREGKGGSPYDRLIGIGGTRRDVLLSRGQASCQRSRGV